DKWNGHSGSAIAPKLPAKPAFQPTSSHKDKKENGQTSPSGGDWPSVQGGWVPSGRLVARAMVVRHPATWHLHHRKVFPDDDWLGAGYTNVPARLVAGFTVENGR
ncbi:MAG: hypothetical protein EBV45_01565, partial [Chloroflexi bacterium]|nr:hypothetical protein [Chloroflexota bacterium]